MAIVTETRSSGLVVARDSMDEAAVEKQLKLIDSRLTLQKHWDESCGWVYKVICFVSDTYAPVVLTWKDEHGHPLPLSSALSDKMQSLMLGARKPWAQLARTTRSWTGCHRSWMRPVLAEVPFLRPASGVPGVPPCHLNCDHRFARSMLRDLANGRSLNTGTFSSTYSA